MRYPIIGAIFLLLIVTVTGCSSEASMKKDIQKQANELGNAFVTNNYEVILDYIYPQLIDSAGGREFMTKMWKDGIADMQRKGFRLEKITIGEPSRIVEAGAELHCLVPETIVMDLADKKVTSESYLLAVSKDKGKKWYFIDTAPLTNENIRQLLPNYNPVLKIPAKKEPVVVNKY